MQLRMSAIHLSILVHLKVIAIRLNSRFIKLSGTKHCPKHIVPQGKEKSINKLHISDVLLVVQGYIIEKVWK